MKKETTVLLLAALCCLSQDLTAGSWPTYHGDYTLTGVSADSFGGKPVRLWRTKLGKDIISSAVGGDGRLFCVADARVVTAIDSAGNKLWARTVRSEKLSAQGEPVDEKFSAPLLYVGKQLLVAASTDGNVYGLSPKDGGQLWVYKAGSKIDGTPNFSASEKKGEPDRIFVMEQNPGVLHALDAQDGSGLWTSEKMQRTDGHIAVSGEHVVFGNCLSTFFAVNIADGRKAAAIRVGKECEMAGGTALSGGRAFAGNRSGSMAAADLDSAKVRWLHEESSGELFTTPAVTDRRVVFCGGDAIVYCVDRESGDEQWKYDTRGSTPLSPVVAGELVIAAVDGKLFGLSLNDGELSWTLTVSDEISEPAIVDGMIVVGLDDGHVAAYGDAK